MTLDESFRRGVCRLPALVSGFCLSVATLAGVAGTEPSSWKMIADTGQGRLYHRDVADSSLPEAMIVTRLDAPPGRVFALVTDYDHFAEFIPDVAESRVLERDGDRTWVFHQLHFGGPVADRVYVIESRNAVSGPTGMRYRVEWKLADRRFPELDRASGVRPRAFSGFWDLQPLEGGASTQAAYAVHSDPGGMIPGWLVTAMTDRYIQQVIAALRRRLLAKE
jgi:ribosome-associated toxin RatA of RatAB toxin-antitoxin module